MAQQGSSDGDGRHPFFNDRRFTITTSSQRLRENVHQVLNQFNRQLSAENPHLLHELAGQLNRLQELLNTNPNNGNTTTQNVNNTQNVVLQMQSSASSSQSQGTSQRESAAQPLQSVYADDEVREDGDEVSTSDVTPSSNGAVVLTMDLDRVEGIAPSQNDAEGGPAENNEQRQQQTAGAAWDELLAAIRAPELQGILRAARNIGPFLVILLLKWTMTFAAGINMLIMLTLSFLYAENVIELAVASSRTQQIQKWRLLCAMAVLGFNVAAVYAFFEEDFYLALIFQPTQTLLEEVAGGIHFLTIMWLVVVTDFIAKFSVIFFKCLVVSGPTLGWSHRRKARIHQWLEYTSHIYRHWLPTVPWSYYLSATAPGTGIVKNGISTILFLTYLILKFKTFIPKAIRWWRSSTALLRPVPFGFSPSSVELRKIGPTCSICYGNFTNPVQLSCKHIFCEDCVTTWLDKQKTCPLCRTQVITDDNRWKDGGTSYCIQLM